MSSGNVPRYKGNHTGTARLRSRLYASVPLYPDSMEIQKRGGETMDIKKILYWISVVGPVLDIVIGAIKSIMDVFGNNGTINNKFVK